MLIVNEKGAFDIRPAAVKDLDYIRPSWMRTYMNSPEMNQPGLVSADFYRMTHLLLDELISRSSALGAAYVCYVAGAPDIIRGYLIGEPTRDVAFLHWVAVKKPEWGKGVGSALMEQYCKDFDLRDPRNILYTFSSRAMLPTRADNPRRGFAKYVQKKYNLVYYPWFKYTSMEPGWETGR